MLHVCLVRTRRNEHAVVSPSEEGSERETAIGVACESELHNGQGLGVIRGFTMVATVHAFAPAHDMMCVHNVARVAICCFVA